MFQERPTERVNERHSICIGSWKFDICSSLYQSRHSIHHWEIWQILDQSWDWSLEDCQEDNAIFTEDYMKSD